jgi:hypothetical protein
MKKNQNYFKLFFLIIIQLITTNSIAVNPYLSIKVLPEFPNEFDDIKIVVKAYYIAAASQVGIGFEKYGNNIAIRACDRAIFGYSANYEFIDTLNVGRLPIGINFISHKRIHWNSVDSCFSSNYFLLTDSFEVFQSTGQFEKNYIYNNLSIYPNPISDVIHIKKDGGVEVTEVYLIDIFGKQLDVFDRDNFPINISNYKCGVYTLRINTKDGIITKRIVKQ